MYTKLFGHHLLRSSYFLEAENGNLEDRHAVAVIKTAPRVYFSSTHSATPIIHGRLLTKTELLPWAFNQVNTVYKTQFQHASISALHAPITCCLASFHEHSYILLHLLYTSNSFQVCQQPRVSTLVL